MHNILLLQPILFYVHLFALNSQLSTFSGYRVEFVDSFGRTRRCLRKDLAAFQQQDAEMAKPSTVQATSYGNFVKAAESKSNEDESNMVAIFGGDDEAKQLKRKLWEEEEAANKAKPNLHYGDVLYEGKRILQL